MASAAGLRFRPGTGVVVCGEARQQTGELRAHPGNSLRLPPIPCGLGGGTTHIASPSLSASAQDLGRSFARNTSQSRRGSARSSHLPDFPSVRSSSALWAVCISSGTALAASERDLPEVVMSRSPSSREATAENERGRRGRRGGKRAAAAVEAEAEAELREDAGGLTQGEAGDGGGGGVNWEDVVSREVAEEVTQRLQRLEGLMLVKRLYRDVARAERVLRIPVPRVVLNREGTQELKVRRSKRSMNDWIQRGWRRHRTLQLDAAGPGTGAARGGLEEDGAVYERPEVDSPRQVLDFADDIRELAHFLKNDMLQIKDRLPLVFSADKDGDVGDKVRSTVEQLERQLKEQARRVDNSLSAQERAEALQERQRELQEQEENVQARVLRRLEGLSSRGQVVLGRVIEQRIPAVDLSQIDISLNPSFLQDVKKFSAKTVETLSDLWRRLNGLPAACDLEPLAAGLPRPQPTVVEEEDKKVALVLQVEALDKKLGEGSRVRESRLRQRNALARTRLATEIRKLDDEVNEIRKELAVRTLQLEMQQIYISLEQELLLSAGSQDQRSEEEESLIIAEFGLLDADLAPLRTAVDRQEAILVSDDELGVLAMDIPDLKQRLGIVEEPTVPLAQRVKLTADEAQGKVKEGSGFLWRGLRLLGGDLVYCARLFWAAANGTTLKAREVQTLRRTAKDVLVLVPFTIILIAPITPVGHVVVFSFIQKYFPGFFPSSFSSRRQEVMKRYEVLKLEMASAASDADKEVAEAMAAAAAAETFEAREEDDKGGLQGLFVGFSSQATASADGRSSRSSRLWRDDPRKLRLLQEKLPGISRLLADMQELDSAQKRDSGLPQVLEDAGTKQSDEAQNGSVVT